MFVFINVIFIKCLVEVNLFGNLNVFVLLFKGLIVIFFNNFVVVG